jgi:Tol biopolymer transport system component
MKNRGGIEREPVKDPVTGRNIWRLTNKAGAHDIQPYYDIDSWSPDGSKIIFSSAAVENLRDTGAMMVSDEGHIYTLDTKTGEIRWVIGNQHFDSHTGCFPVWHPSGRWMLFGSGNYEMNDLHMSIIDLETMKSEEYNDLCPRQISPDGSSVLCFSPEGVRLFDFETRTSKVILTFAQCVDIIPEKVPPEGTIWTIRNLKYNQDGTMFILRFSSQPQVVKYLMVANIDGTGLTKLNTPSHKWHHHSWLPGSRSVLFGDRVDGVSYLYRIDIDNSNLRLISKHPLAGHPLASPDGRRIVTDENKDTKKGLGIYLLDLVADTVERVASITVNLKRSNAHPVWNHEGTQILYHSDHMGYSNLYLIDLNNG